jgi:hypothetical protein
MPEAAKTHLRTGLDSRMSGNINSWGIHNSILNGPNKINVKGKNYHFIFGRTLYVRVPKCGSTSFVNAIQDAYSYTDLTQADGIRSVDLMTVDWDQIDNIFLITRNPFDRLVSCWNNRVLSSPRVNLYWPHSTPIEKFRDSNDFSGFASMVCKAPDIETDGHCRSIHSFLYGIPFTIPLLKIDLFDLSSSWDEIVKCLSVDESVAQRLLGSGVGILKPAFETQPVTLEELPVKRLLYKDYYTAEVREKVSVRYAADLAIFEYGF